MSYFVWFISCNFDIKLHELSPDSSLADDKSDSCFRTALRLGASTVADS